MAYRGFVVFTCLLAFTVIVLGAYARLGDAGLGCLDWPGCYGQLTVPASAADVADKRYLEQGALEPEKGWKEMIHRCFAGILGLAILAIAIWSWKRRRADPDQPVRLPTLLLLVGSLLLLQLGLGIGNVLLHLPLGVATAHNGVVAWLLVSMIYLNFRLWRQQH